MGRTMFSTVIVAAFLLAALNVFAQEQAPAPVFQEGDTWIFRVTEKEFQTQSTRAMDGDYEVIYSRGKVKVRRPGGEEIEVRQGGELIRILGIEDDKREYLQFPLFVGKKWNADYLDETRGSGGRQVNWRAETSVTGMGEITTPAGSFKAFKIERYATGAVAHRGGKGGGKLSRLSYTYYYSPQTRSIVKYNYQSGEDGGKREIELIKFASGR